MLWNARSGKSAIAQVPRKSTIQMLKQEGILLPRGLFLHCKKWEVESIGEKAQ